MRRIALAAAAFLLVSCAGVRDLARSAVKEPRLTFRSAALQALDMEGATLGFTWDVENPNGFGVDLARAGWTLDVEGTRVAAGDLPGGLEIRANATAPVTFPVRVRFQDVPGIVSLLRGGKDALQYRLGGTVGVRTPVGVVDLPLSHSDRLPLPSVPSFALDGVSVRGVSVRELALEVRVRVANPNAFAVPAGKLDYALSIGGAPVARAEGARLPEVSARGSTVVAIPVRLDLGSAGRAAAELSGGGEVDVGLSGRAHVAGIPLPLELRARVPARR
jgi:LEA14-like dessication related protein